MIDTRKVWTAVAVAVGVVAAIVLVIVLSARTIGSDVNAKSQAAASASAEAAASSPTPIETPAEASPAADAYDQELSTTAAIYKRAKTAALAASAWDGADSRADRQADYIAAGISPSLAQTYMPVWSEVFGKNITAKITTTVDGKPGLNAVTGKAGHRQYRVGVTVIYSGSWTADGKPGSQDPATATWWVTVDEATGRVVQIDQPAAGDLQIRLAS